MDELPKVDVILISHNHYDHLDIASLKMLQKQSNPIIIAGLGVDALLKSEGFDRVVSLDWWESHSVANIKYTFTPCRHFSGRGLFDRNQTLWGAFVVESREKKIYFGGDTGYGKHFSMVAKKFGPMDLAFIPIGAYEPRWVMKDVHLNPKEAITAHLDLQSKRSVGIHFGTFDDLTDEGINEPATELAKERKKQAIADDEFITPKFGQSYRL